MGARQDFSRAAVIVPPISCGKLFDETITIPWTTQIDFDVDLDAYGALGFAFYIHNPEEETGIFLYFNDDFVDANYWVENLYVTGILSIAENRNDPRISVIPGSNETYVTGSIMRAAWMTRAVFSDCELAGPNLLFRQAALRWDTVANVTKISVRAVGGVLDVGSRFLIYGCL